MMPPAVLMQDVSEPKLRGRTNDDLAVLGLQQREARRLANADNRGVRQRAGSKKKKQ